MPYRMMSIRKPYPSDVTEEEWQFVAPYLTLLPLDAGQRRLELVRFSTLSLSGASRLCPWRMLPNDLPRWAMVYPQVKELAQAVQKATRQQVRLVFVDQGYRGEEPARRPSRRVCSFM